METKSWCEDLVQSYVASRKALSSAVEASEMSPEIIAQNYFGRYVMARVGYEIATQVIEQAEGAKQNKLSESQAYQLAAQLVRSKIEAEIFDNKWQPVRSGVWTNPCFVQRGEALCLLRHELTLLLESRPVLPNDQRLPSGE